ncbi:MAG: AMP-binding protein [Alphaproteobacteria bacterium]|nr:AMP-binding protein [Alphaproteobacteria bacterium]
MSFSSSKINEIVRKIGKWLLDSFTNGLFKAVLLALIAVRITQDSSTPANIIAGLFLLPFFIFSARATVLAKRYGRANATSSVLLTELCIMVFAGLLFMTKQPLAMILLPIAIGITSCVNGPIRFVFHPEHLDEKSFRTVKVSTRKTTYCAIILAIIVGTLLPVRLSALVLMVFAIIGYLISKFTSILEKEEDKPSLIEPKLKFDRELFSSVKKSLHTVYHYPLIFRCIAGTSWFWAIGLLILLSVYPLVRNTFATRPEAAVAYFLIIYAIGVGCGIKYCTRLMRGIANATYVPLAALGVALCFVCLTLLTFKYNTPDIQVRFRDFIFQPRPLIFSMVYFGLAFCSGMYVAPINMMINQKTTDANRAQVFAIQTIINSCAIAVMGVFFAVCRRLDIGIQGIFMIYALFCCIVSIYNISIIPDALVRSLVQTILEFAYRVRVKGLPHFEEAGKRVLIIANHTSLLDGLLIGAFMPEKITFVIKPEWKDRWFTKIFKLMVDVVPLDMNNALTMRALVDILKKNTKVMIFPEQRVSVNGGLMKVYEGAGVVAEKANANILPICINGAQYSKFSLLKHQTKTVFFPKISISIMPPKRFNVAPELTGRRRTHEISLQLYNMMTDMKFSSAKLEENLFKTMLNASIIYGKNHIIAEDISRKTLTYRQLILKSYALGQTLKRSLPATEENIAVMMPNVLANLVLIYSLFGIDKVPAMLNFSSGIKQVLSCISTVQIKTVITSHKFIENGKLEKLEEAILEAGIKILYMEDIGASVNSKDKTKGIIRMLIKSKPRRQASDTAVILFTSGSEGMPKAVLLSHRNFQANKNQIMSVLGITPSDVFFNALPMFHSFGLGVGTIFTTSVGMKSFYYPSPLHFRVIPELAYASNATIICGTDTFFAGYANSAHPYDFYSLRLAIVGAEKLKETTAKLWNDKFGIRILEGYGATECSPIISVNTPMYVKKGSVGRLLPGMESKLEEVPGIENGKRLFVRGDNIMRGYMKCDNPGKLLPPEDGWHDTGDIVDIDNDGFITILGRAKRFAKIGGEMISLTAVEQAINSLYEGFINGVVAISDPKKGEQLVLITTCEKADVSEIKVHIKSAGLNDLGSPAKIMVVKEPPLLGTGKFDYVSATKMAEEKFKEE